MVNDSAMAVANRRGFMSQLKLTAKKLLPTPPFPLRIRFSYRCMARWSGGRRCAVRRGSRAVRKSAVVEMASFGKLYGAGPGDGTGAERPGKTARQSCAKPAHRRHAEFP